MARVFISYSKQDSEPARRLAELLEKHGHSVWWDLKIRSGEVFRDVIDRELEAADAVIVIWTSQSIASKWVIAEAEHGDECKKLVTLRTTDVDPRRIPKPFNTYHTPLVDDHLAITTAVAVFAPSPTTAAAPPATIAGAPGQQLGLDPPHVDVAAATSAGPGLHKPAALKSMAGGASAFAAVALMVVGGGLYWWRAGDQYDSSGQIHARSVDERSAAEAGKAVATVALETQLSEERKRAAKAAEDARFAEERRRAAKAAEDARFAEERKQAAKAAEDARLAEERKQAAKAAEDARLAEERKQAAKAAEDARFAEERKRAAKAAEDARLAEERKQAVKAAEDARLAAEEAQRLETERLLQEIQTELKRVGCYLGEPDGKWGARTRSALETYGRQVKVADAQLEPSNELLKALKVSSLENCSIARPAVSLKAAPKRTGRAPESQTEGPVREAPSSSGAGTFHGQTIKRF
jgi:flagellar biosynthesis GTPase FlhF